MPGDTGYTTGASANCSMAATGNTGYATVTPATGTSATGTPATVTPATGTPGDTAGTPGDTGYATGTVENNKNLTDNVL